MSIAREGVVDCDIHIPPPDTKHLLPYLDKFWRDTVVNRGINGLWLTSVPQRTPFAIRPDRKAAQIPEDGNIKPFVDEALAAHGTRYAICNCLYGGQAILNEDLGAALISAANDWIAREWLDRDPRLRASIIVSARNPERAVAEIERVAADRRFVQVLMMAGGAIPMGRKPLWPIYAAAVKHQLPVGVHAGSLYAEQPAAIGWPLSCLEEYADQSFAFQHQLLSLITEGVFTSFPALKFVFCESGYTWLPAFLWRVDKTWRGLRTETPWVNEAPSEIVKKHIRFSLQPDDAPPARTQMERLLEHLGSDELLLFSTDYPHWHYDGDEVLPRGMSPELAQKIMVKNAFATYPRLVSQ